MTDQPQTEPTVNLNASLFKKMAAVMGQIGRIEKKGKHQQGYEYATESDIADVIRDAMAEQGLALFVSMDSSIREDHGERTSGGKVRWYTHAVFTFTLCDSDTGATIDRRWEGEAIDEGDKGLSKAAVFAEKTFLMKTFLVSTGDEVPAGKQLAAELSRVDVVEEDGKNRLTLVCGTKNKTYNIRAYSRQPFIKAGWITDDDWKETGAIIPMHPFIPVKIAKKGDYWELVSVEPNLYPILPKSNGKPNVSAESQDEPPDDLKPQQSAFSLNAPAKRRVG